jgi:hypothetical protein
VAAEQDQLHVIVEVVLELTQYLDRSQQQGAAAAQHGMEQEARQVQEAAVVADVNRLRPAEQEIHHQ